MDDIIIPVEDQDDSLKNTVILPPRKALREAIEEVFYKIGGPEDMINWVQESTVNRRIFYKDILPKLIPREMRGEIGGRGSDPIKMVIEWATQPNIPSAVTTSAISSMVSEMVASNNTED